MCCFFEVALFYVGPPAFFFPQKSVFLDFLDMPICEKVHISSYLGIFQMTAAAAAAAASQELSPFGKTPGVPRAGTKYPVQGNPSLRLIRCPLWEPSVSRFCLTVRAK